MENRFGFKDFILLTLLAAVIIMIGLAMVQYDRQWDVMKQILAQGDQQQQELSRLQRTLANGVAVAPNSIAPTTTPSATTIPSTGIAATPTDPFYRIKQIEDRPDYAKGDWFVENFSTKVGKLTPLLSTDEYSGIVQARVQESLLYTDPYHPDTTGDLPLLATSWHVKDNRAAWQTYVDARLKFPVTRAEILNEDDCPSADPDRETYVQRRLKEGRIQDDVTQDPDCPPALSITFILRQGVTFSDGVPFTADDVVFTLQMIMNPAIEAPRQRAAYNMVRDVKRDGDYQVTFHFRKPYFAALDLVGGLQILPKHFYSKFTPDQFNTSVGLLMGTGPYCLADPENWHPSGDPIILVRNENYWGEPGPFDEIHYLQTLTDAANMTMFINGEEDQFSALPEQYNKLLADPAVLARTQHFEYENALSGYGYIAWNQLRNGKPTVFADKRVRQAMTLLIDRERICKEVELGYAIPACGPFSRLTKQHDPDVHPWPHDVARAKQMLKDLGFTDNGNGVLANAAGQQLHFKLIYSSDSETIERIVLMIKDDLAKGGIAMEPDPTEFPIMLKRLDDRDYDAITLGWDGGIETDIFQMFDSAMIKDNGDNCMNYSNPQLDKLIEQARIEVDPVKRMPLWQQCEKILYDDQPYTFLTTRESLAFFDKRIKNIETTPLGLNYVGLDVMPIPWYVPLSERKWNK